MLGQEVSRLLKGTFFAKSELTMVNLEAETNQIRILQSLSKFLEASLSVKKTVQIVDLSEHVESFLEASESGMEFSEQVKLLEKVFTGVGSDFLILKNIDFFLELVDRP